MDVLLILNKSYGCIENLIALICQLDDNTVGQLTHVELCDAFDGKWNKVPLEGGVVSFIFHNSLFSFSHYRGTLSVDQLFFSYFMDSFLTERLGLGKVKKLSGRSGGGCISQVEALQV